MKKIIFHIGYPKTGTTTLKKIIDNFYTNWFYLNKEESNHIIQKKLRYLSDSIFLHNKSNKLELLINEILINCKNLDFDYFFLSIEDILTFEDVGKRINLIFLFKIISKLEKHFNIEILITIRNQADMLESNFAYNYHNYFKKFDGNINLFFKKANKNKNLLENLNFKKILTKINSTQKKIYILPMEYMRYPSIYKNKLKKIFINKKKIIIYSENVTTGSNGNKKIIKSSFFNYFLKIHLYLKKNYIYEVSTRKIRRFIKRIFKKYYIKEIQMNLKLKENFQKKFYLSNKYFLKKNRISTKIFKDYIL